MYENMGNVVNFAIDHDYWSSSESSSDNAWLQNGLNFYQNDYKKDWKILVRAIRAF